MNAKSEPTALILEVQKMSTEDGPGIRATVFFKGCPLKCAWCHNPESISPLKEMQWIDSRCIGCRSCIEACPQKALKAEAEGIVRSRAQCLSCGACAKECPTTAMEVLGCEWTVDALIAEVVKDRAYFEKSGGGVTVSGGEPTLQHKFVAAFLRGLKALGIHTALDTCGQCGKEVLAGLLPYTDLVMFDLKLIDPVRHKELTGFANERILANLEFIKMRMASSGVPLELWVRTPIIPRATATKDNISGIGKFIASRLGTTVSRWDLCAFNRLCRDKYVRLGIDWPYKNVLPLTAEFMENLVEVARVSGVDPAIVRGSGEVRTEEDEERAKEARAQIQAIPGGKIL